jgi:hypothetical protein
MQVGVLSGVWIIFNKTNVKIKSLKNVMYRKSVSWSEK